MVDKNELSREQQSLLWDEGGQEANSASAWGSWWERTVIWVWTDRHHLIRKRQRKRSLQEIRTTGLKTQKTGK
jgi:hypothetical protein